jgi:sulfatase modifying factor 1
MTREADFLRALADEPDDWDARLVFADWLDEKGDVRAEFVRVTADLDGWVPDLPRRCLLQERQGQWLARHSSAWLEPVRPFVSGWSLDRGLVRLHMTAAQYTAADFAERAPEHFARCWVRTVRLEGVTAKDLLGILRQPHLGKAPRLEIESAGLDDAAGCSLARCPHLTGVRELGLANNQVTKATLQALLGGPVGECLRCLDLRNNEVEPDPDDLRASCLRHLDLHGNSPWTHRFQGECPEVCRRGDRLTNSIGMEFRRIPAGTFLMGSPDDELHRYPDEGPRRPVTLTRAFYLGAYPVTWLEFHRVFGGPLPASHAHGHWRPVDGVSCETALAYCAGLSALPEERARGHTYRLPTEAEWEHACRAGTTTAYWWGDTATSYQANFDGHYPHGQNEVGPYLERTSVVGAYAANPFGLYDVHGNVWEWVADWFDPEYYASGPEVDPTGPVRGNKHILRGGSWYHLGRCSRSAYRLENDPGDPYRGLRVVLELS